MAGAVAATENEAITSVSGGGFCCLLARLREMLGVGVVLEAEVDEALL